MIQIREELNNKISNIEEEGKLRATEFYQVLTEECQKNRQEVVKELEERHQELQLDVNNRVEKVYTVIDKIDGLTRENREKIQGISIREKQMQEELDALREKPYNHTQFITSENREMINFRSYRRNPIEFLKRVEELIEKNRETRWSSVRSMIDEMFRDTHDNWWTATRPEINDTQEFKKQFREKYWSESTQNVFRNDISNGRYETQGGHTLTSYFLGKVCLARNLEPRIPEESLVIQLGYHYEEAIQKARRQGQIKTIQGMVSLLEDLSIIHI